MNHLFVSVLLLWVVVLSVGSPALAKEFDQLRTIAARSITTDIRTLSSGYMLTAGDARLRGGFWTRDFSFAAAGLHAIGRADVVRDQLTRTLAFLRSDGCLPRTMASSPGGLARFFILYFGAKRPVPHEPLTATYGGGGNGPETVDSNALLLVAAVDYLERTGDRAWWDAHEAELVSAYRYYDHLLKDGVVVQDDYADWQDGVRRRGPVMFANVAYWSAMSRLQKFPAFGIDAARVSEQRARVIARFMSPEQKVFISMPGQPYVSLEDNLLAIAWGLFPSGSSEAKNLYAALKAHPIWSSRGMPGFATYPDYPDSWVGSHDKTMGLRHYHDSLIWSWLVGLSAKVSRLMGDTAEADRIFGAMEAIAVRDKTISEIYRPQAPYSRWSTLFNRSEISFAWGSGVILDALATRERSTP